jgi:hypothetical protein
MQVTIQNLMPATVYIFKVSAHNKHGLGESSAPLRVETQPEGRSSPVCQPHPEGDLYKGLLYVYPCML